jgi:hypothetical protein
MIRNGAVSPHSGAEKPLLTDGLIGRIGAHHSNAPCGCGSSPRILPLMKFVSRSISLLIPLAVTASAMAQATGTGPRQPKVDAVPSPVIGYGLFLVFAGIILAISLYPSKRAHSDL